MRFPSIAAVARELRAVNAETYDTAGVAEDEQSIDVRLQVYPDGTWAIRWGDSSYDLDHRGYWGASSVPGNGRRFRSEEVARDLIEQARDHHAQSEP